MNVKKLYCRTDAAFVISLWFASGVFIMQMYTCHVVSPKITLETARLGDNHQILASDQSCRSGSEASTGDYTEEKVPGARHCWKRHCR